MKYVFYGFMALYGLALALLVIGVFGLFGQEQDPLSAVFLLPLGLPWNVLADKAGMTGPAALAFAPVINGAILFALWKRFGR